MSAITGTGGEDSTEVPEVGPDEIILVSLVSFRGAFSPAGQEDWFRAVR